MILRVGLCLGLTAEMVQQLKNNGVKTVVDLVSSDLEVIARKCSLSYKALVAVRRVLLAQFSSFPVNGANLYEDLKSSTAILSTGNKSFDTLLDGGLYTGEVMELTGAPGSGKTQVCLHIAANVSESLKQHVLYIDSTAGFTATRLMQLFQRRTETEEGQMEALQRVQVVRVFDAYKLLDVLHEFRSTVAQEVISASAPVKILVVDSVSSVIYPLLGSRQPDGMALLMHVARELKTLAKELGVAVVVTNHVTRDASSGQTKPALGRSWSFVPSTRVLLENSKESCGKTGTRRGTASLTNALGQPVGIQIELDLENWEPMEGAC
ncbi:DNA repair protein RAD51 homolog 4 [Sphaerodactylus townsendi]|uniref:DNA repair protein RAD51 homolog 4 n=1 Tax=Sphaerodactylus townsendi TaxID=933632 RepID=UPI0020262E8D|nr:DNA repair protein RAD51 homolog 4 [Sphaerodactylus townsendi]XP_048375486.1 DNA repair protein RAD51 homolog 4 [Sphaerodactylus townsendi]